MKKIIFLFLMFLPFSLFAGVDTDRVCADTNLYGSLPNEKISVYYPWENVFITNLWKVTVWSVIDSENLRLFYVVNVHSGDTYSRSEVYMYNCGTKKPSLIANLAIKSGYEPYRLTYATKWEILLMQHSTGMLPPPSTIIGIDGKTSKRLFTILNAGSYFGRDWKVTWFASWINGWYFIYEDGYFNTSTFYKVDKISKKLSKI